MKKPIMFFFALLLPGLSSFAQERLASAMRDTTGRLSSIQYGIASYYSNKFEGKPTAAGEVYDKKAMTAAHNALPFGTWIRVTNLSNKKSVVVKVNDRLHHRNRRLVDLSLAAATMLGYTKKGLTRVKVEVLGKKKPAETVDGVVNK